MNTLILDLIDRHHDGYIIQCNNIKLNKYHVLYLPMSIYNWYTNDAMPFESTTYSTKINKDDKYTDVTITKEMELNYNQLNPSGWRMKIEFKNNLLYISDNKFIKVSKSYCFQTFVDIKIFDGNSRLTHHNYKFLKNYDTKSKAVYFINKFAHRFSLIHKKYLKGNKVTFDIVLPSIVPFHSDIIYEHEYMYRTKDGNGTALYKFTIVVIEKG